jgi:hypothetical protein
MAEPASVDDPAVPTARAMLRVVLVRDESEHADEILEAVGRGAPTILLGTSTKSLRRSIQRLFAARRAETD